MSLNKKFCFFICLRKRFPTFGKDFENQCAKSEQDIYSRSYRQIVDYKFGNLRFIVRFEVDCADYDKSQKISVESKSPTEGSVSDLMKTLTLSDILKPDKLPGSGLSVIKSGERFNYHLVELTTCFRSHKRSFPKYSWPQLFFSGTQTLVIGWHYKGNVTSEDDVKVYEFEVT